MSNKKIAPLGVFDSGVGGLTVVMEMFQQMPHESFVYYADTAHVPYGPRNPLELKEFASNITAFLVNQGCKMVIIACNTSTSLAYQDLKARYDIPLIGVIEPGVDKALEVTRNRRIGVIGTVATINSGSYQKMIKEKKPDTEIVAVPCPLFVPLIEAGKVEGDEVYQAAVHYLEPVRKAGVDTLILGCTHYPFLLPVIQDIVGPGVIAVDPARETVKRAVVKLQELDLLQEEGRPVHRYYASGDPEAFRRTGSEFLQQDIGVVKKITLD